jgi:hypothetical protein
VLYTGHGCATQTHPCTASAKRILRGNILQLYGYSGVKADNFRKKLYAILLDRVCTTGVEDTERVVSFGDMCACLSLVGELTQSVEFDYDLIDRDVYGMARK